MADFWRAERHTSRRLQKAATRARRCFAPDCGSHLWVTGVGEGPKVYGIRVGTARQRDQLKPTRQVWHQSALNWVDRIGDLPAAEKGG
jgi:hypothetical protein